MEYKATLSEAGRVVIPIEIRNKLGLKPGDSIFFSDDEELVKIKTRRSKLLELRQKVLKATPPGVDLLAELIAERREEARKEAEE